MNKKGVHEHHGILVMLALGLLGIGLLLYSAGIVDLSSVSSGTAGLTGLAGGELNTQEEPFSATPANQPPTYTGSALITPIDTPLVIDLAPLFTDPENDALTFLATSEDQVAVDVTDSTITFTPAAGFTGERTITIVVSDGVNLLREPVRLTVGDAAAAEFSTPTPEEQQATEEPAQNETLPPETPPPEPPAASFGTQDIVTGCEPGPVFINTSTTLSNNLLSNGSCIVINASNIFLNCAGFNITGNGSDITGVNATNVLNITIRDCIISNYTEPIKFEGTNNSNILNTTAKTSNISFASGKASIRIINSHNNTLANLTLEAGANHNAFSTDSNNLTFSNSIGVANGTTAVSLSGNDHTLINVTGVNTLGTGAGLGIGARSIVRNSFGSSGGSTGVQVTGSFTRVFNTIGISNTSVGFSITGSSVSDVNVTNVTGTSNTSFGLTVNAAHNATIINSTGHSNSSGGLYFINGANKSIIIGGSYSSNTGDSVSFGTAAGGSNNLFFNVTFLTNNTWIDVDSIESVGNNFTNATFLMPNGSIAISNFTLPANTTVTLARLNITFNRAFLNSTNLTFMNTTGIVTLNGISAIDPKPQVDFEDDGTFTDCTSTADPFCTELSYSGGVFTFNTSHFTSFQSTDAAVVTDCATINVSSILTQNVTNAGNCMTIGANNVDFNCNGFNITYGTGGGSEVFGINISNRFNTTVRNCGIFKGSSGGARTYGIAFINSSGGVFANNTIVTNGTEENDGIHTGVVASVNFTFAINTVTLVTNDGNVNSPFCTNVTNLGLCQVCFDTPGVSCASLGQSACPDGEGYKSDDILKFNVSSGINITSGNIQVIGGEAVFCNLNGNTTISFGVRNNCGSFRSATFSGAFFVAGENNLTCFVSGGGKEEDNGFKLVSFGYEGVSAVTTLAIPGNSRNVTATGNIIVADGGLNTRGIFLDAHNSNISFNTVTTAGGNDSYGITLGSENTTIGFNNITTTDGGKSRGVVVVATNSNVTDNIITITGTAEEREGIFVIANRTNLFNNNITIRSGRFSHGIHILGAILVNVTGNNLSVGGGNGSHGILLTTTNATVAQNNISVNTSSLSHGIMLPSAVAAGNSITGNTIRVNSRGGNALNVVTAAGNTFIGNTIVSANVSGVFLDHALNNTFSGSTLALTAPSSLFILQDNGSINYTQALTLATSTNLARVVRITHNATHVNATDAGGSQLNGTAILRFFSLPGDGVIPVFDDADDGTFDVCGGSRCLNTTYNQSTGILQYNVTHFTTYAAQEVSACATIDNIENATTLNVTLTNNVTSTIDCFMIAAENVTFNCAGNTILYDSAGLGGDGIIVEHTTNVLIRDCIIRDISFGGAYGIGINITNTSNVTLLNNTIFTNGTSNNHGIFARAFNATTHTNFTFINNTVRTRGSSFNNTGIQLQGGNITGIIILNNTIDTNGTDSNDGIRLSTIFFGHSFIRDARIIQNNIIANGSVFRNNGIFSGNYFSGSTGNVHTLVIANNTIQTFGTSSFNNGMFLLGTASNVTILQNNISTNTTTGGSSSGILFETFNSLSVIENNTIHNNSIRTRSIGSSSIGIEVQNFAGGRLRNTTITYNDIITNGTSSNHGVELVGTVNANVENNTIISGGSSSGNAGISMSTSYANITIHNNLINTTGTGFDHGISASGGIDPENITVTRNNITTGSHRVDISSSIGNNRGMYFTSVTGSLVRDNVVYTNGSFNNTGIFVGVSSSFNTVANNTVVTGGNESENAGIGLIQVKDEFGSVASNNVTNNTVNTTGFGRSPSSDVGILLMGLGNSGAVENNIVRINTVHARGNDSDNYGVYLVGIVRYNNITNNQVLTNGTDQNHGVTAFSPSASFQVSDNIIEWNNITAWGIASTDNVGIFFRNLVVRNNVTDNNITTRGSDRNHGVFINASSNNNLVERNNFTLQTFGTGNIGLIIQGSANNTFRNNILRMNTSPLDGGMQLLSNANGNNISNNTIVTNGTVLKIVSSTLNIIQDQNLSSRLSEGAVLAGALLNNFTNTIIASDQHIALNILPGVGNGSFYDGFEDGNITPFTSAGNQTWAANNTHVNSGTFSAQANDINDSQHTALILEINTTGASTISFARKIESESCCDFLRFSINGVLQTSFSGITNFSTFNFTYTGTGNTVFVWNYTKDSSISTRNDTAWVDDVNITFEGNGSKNNTFLRAVLFTNNTWLFIGENNTNNTLENTTFIGRNGTINILPIVHITQNANVTIGRLNNTHNLTFLNSTALRFLNTTAILRFLQILYIDPAPFRDLEDDGTFGYCPPSRCAELAYIDNQFIYNTSGFSFYASAEGQVNLSINKTDSPDPVPVSSQLNYTIVVNNSGSSTAFNLTLLEIYPPEVIFLTAQPTPSSGNNTFFLGNLTPESQIVLNITVFVRNITADTVINNTINATFLNQSNATIRTNVTENTTVTNPAVLNMSTVSITKTDSPDPVNASQNLTYVINVTSNGPGIARNVTVNDTYPAQIIFLTAQPTPVTGTNNTFFLGNITNGTSVLINITVLVRNISNGTVINNSANVTFQNNTNFTFTALATASTTVNNPPQINASAITVSKADNPDPVSAGAQLNYTITVTSTGGATAFNVTVNETYPSSVIFNSGQPAPTGGNTTFILGNLTPGTVVVINITVNVSSGASGTLTNIVNATFQNETSGVNIASDSETTTISAAPAPSAGGSGGGWTTPTVGGVQLEQPAQAPPGPCIENWACDDWTACSLGRQSRVCYDQNQCNMTQYVPVLARTCMDLTPPAPEPEEEPLALPDIKVEQEAPAIETPRWSICAIMPLIVDGALLVLAVLVLLYLILTARQRAEKYWRTILDAAAGIILALLITQYVTCKEFLPFQYGVFILLALFVLLMRLADHLKARQFAPYTPLIAAPRVTESVPEPEAEPDRAELPPLRITKPAKVPANLKALTAAVKRNEKTMQEFLKVLRKK